MREVKGTALGFVETMGKTAAILAADAMVKAANVTLQTVQQPGGGIITVMCARGRGRGEGRRGCGRRGRAQRGNRPVRARDSAPA